MDIFSYIFQPSVFNMLLPVLLVLSAFVVLSVIRKDKKEKELTERIKRELLAKEDLEKKAMHLEAEVVKLNGELSIKTQMYSGLKDQYNELEKDFDRANKI